MVHERLGSRKNGGRDVWLGKRWLVVAPRGQKDFAIILEIAKPYSALDKGTNLSPATGNDPIRNYEARVGAETRWVFEVADCRKFYELASKRSAKFVETPVDQPWGVTEAMFEDLYGNIFVVKSSRPKPGTAFLEFPQGPACHARFWADCSATLTLQGLGKGSS